LERSNHHGFIEHLFSADGFMPHGHCYLWRPGVLWLHILSDALIHAGVFFDSVHACLFRAGDARTWSSHWMFLCFAVFIVACRDNAFDGDLGDWHPTYWLSGLVKAVTALASVPTAILLVK